MFTALSIMFCQQLWVFNPFRLLLLWSEKAPCPPAENAGQACQGMELFCFRHSRWLFCHEVLHPLCKVSWLRTGKAKTVQGLDSACLAFSQARNDGLVLSANNHNKSWDLRPRAGASLPKELGVQIPWLGFSIPSVLSNDHPAMKSST